MCFHTPSSIPEHDPVNDRELARATVLRSQYDRTEADCHYVARPGMSTPGKENGRWHGPMNFGLIRDMIRALAQ